MADNLAEAARATRPPDKDERSRAYRHATWPEREAMHAAIAQHKADAIAKRVELGRRYLETHSSDIDVPYERAVATVDLIDETRAVRDEAIAMDPEDVISFKVFVQLTDVDDDCGPFHALPAHLSRDVLHAVGYSGVTFLTDERVAEHVGWDRVVKLTGPAGTVGFVDTTRCLHFGGRPRKAGRPVRDQLVFQYLLPTSLLFPIDGDAKHPRFLPQLDATGDEHWDALIGARYT